MPYIDLGPSSSLFYGLLAYKRLIINPSVNDYVITFSASGIIEQGKNWVWVKPGTIVSYVIEAPFCKNVSSSIQVTENTTLDVQMNSFDGRYVLIGTQSNLGVRALSDDAEIWLTSTIPMQDVCTYSASVNEAGLMLCTSSLDNVNKILRSYDGVVFSSSTIQVHTTNITYGNDYFLLYNDGNNSSDKQILRTTDGINFEVINSLNQYILSMTYGKGRFVAVSPDGIRYSEDNGSTWNISFEQNPESNGIKAVTYGDGYFLAVGYSIALYSIDGMSWAMTDFVSGKYYKVVCGNGHFVTGRPQYLNTGEVSILPVGGTTWTNVSYKDACGSAFYAEGKFILPKNGAIGVSEDNGSTWNVEMVGTSNDVWREIVLISQKLYTLTLVGIQSGDMVYFNGEESETGTISVPYGTDVTYTVRRVGYAVKEGIRTVKGDEEIEIALSMTAKLEIITNPMGAAVVLTGPSGTTQHNNSIEVPYNSTVSYIVSETGYTPKTGTVNMPKDKVLSIVLESAE